MNLIYWDITIDGIRCEGGPACPNCFTTLHKSVSICPNCGYDGNGLTCDFAQGYWQKHWQAKETTKISPFSASELSFIKSR